MISTLYFAYHKFRFRVYRKLCGYISRFYFFVSNVQYDKFITIGLPLLEISPTGIFRLGSGVSMVSSARYATLGKNNRCKFVVADNARLIIGNNVGMSNTTIVATLTVEIGNNVLLGGGVVIVDSDFHSLNPRHWHTTDDLNYMKKRPVIIKDNVFIGMDSKILKGVTIGYNSVIAAGSVVSKNVPDNEIWGGNPAKFVKANTLK